MPRIKALNGQSRIRNFCFTLNNPEKEEKQFWHNLATRGTLRAELNVGYVVFQTEKETTEHIQGYVELSNRGYRLHRIKTLFGDRLHIERRLGTQAQAITYCQKTESRIDGVRGEGGIAKKLGKDKLSVVAEIIKQGTYEIKVLNRDYPATFIKYGASIRSYSLDLRGQRDKAPEVIIYYGKTGTGKSAMARKQQDAYWCPWPVAGGWWWPKYAGEETIILDEFRHQIKYDTMLNLLDRYPFSVQEKGSNMNMISQKIIITTNVDPIDWYPNLSDEVKEPLYRRLQDFAKIYDFADNSRWNNIQYSLRPDMGLRPKHIYNFNKNRQELQLIQQDLDEEISSTSGTQYSGIRTIESVETEPTLEELVNQLR